MSDTPWTDALRDRWNSDELIHVEDIFDLAESLERERDEARRERDLLREALNAAMARAYARGYQNGHEDTVEGSFMIVREPDVVEIFADDIRQMLLDGSQPEAAAALAAVKGGEV